MEKKRTKLQEMFIESYCTSRKCIDDLKNEIRELKKKLSENDKAYEGLKNKNNFVTEWYNRYNGEIRRKFETKKQLLERYKEQAKREGNVLGKNYNENLDAIYKEWLKK